MSDSNQETFAGEKPYVCSVCGRAFAQSNDLASHKRRTVCSPPEPLNNAIANVYTIETNDVVQQAVEVPANLTFQNASKIGVTSTNQITYVNGR